jgi:hypothetical protein
MRLKRLFVSLSRNFGQKKRGSKKEISKTNKKNEIQKEEVYVFFCQVSNLGHSNFHSTLDSHNNPVSLQTSDFLKLKINHF